MIKAEKKAESWHHYLSNLYGLVNVAGNNRDELPTDKEPIPFAFSALYALMKLAHPK